MGKWDLENGPKAYDGGVDAMREHWRGQSLQGLEMESFGAMGWCAEEFSRVEIPTDGEKESWGGNQLWRKSQQRKKIFILRHTKSSQVTN